MKGVRNWTRIRKKVWIAQKDDDGSNGGWKKRLTIDNNIHLPLLTHPQVPAERGKGEDLHIIKERRADAIKEGA